MEKEVIKSGIIVVAFAMVTLLAGCNLSKQQTGALIGGGAGAGLGSAIAGTPGAIIGGASGAVLGSEVAKKRK